MLLGLRVPPCTNVVELASFCSAAENAGFDALWFPDSQLLWRDTFVAMALAASTTTRVRLATGVTNVKTRHPSVLASCIRSLQEIARDRVDLGVGAGNSSLRPVNLDLATTDELADTISVVRELLSGAIVTFGKRRVRLKDWQGSCPIYLAATGPRRMALAARIADGVIVHGGTTPERVAKVVEELRDLRLQSEEPKTPFSIIVSGVTLITEDPDRDARLLKPICLTILQDGGGPALEKAGIKLNSEYLGNVEERESQVYPDFKHAEDWRSAVEQADKIVSDSDAKIFGENFCFFGSVDIVARRLSELAEIGVDQVFLQGLYSYKLPVEIVEYAPKLVRAAHVK